MKDKNGRTLQEEIAFRKAIANSNAFYIERYENIRAWVLVALAIALTVFLTDRVCNSIAVRLGW